MLNPLEGLLARLEGAIETRPGRWRARCPGHNSRSRSLSIAEGDDRAVLIHCFAGCEPSAVVNTIGLELSDLFSDHIIRSTRYDKRPRTNYKALVELLLHEIGTLIAAAEAVRNNEILIDEDLDTLYRVLRNLEMARNA